MAKKDVARERHADERPLTLCAGEGKLRKMRAESPSGQPDVDVVVIGGGVNGTGVARDAALRGLRVALFERNDIAFGASGNSSGMIHGGPRYLTYDPEVTYTSCLDSGHIQSIAPHLLFRIPFLVPVMKRLGSKLELFALDAFFGLYDRYQPLKHGKPHVVLDADDVRALEPGLVGELEGAVTFDEWGIDGARLCIGSAVDAHEHGAEVHNHTTVTALLREEGGRVSGVRFRDRLSGETGTCTARAVVNATGAWVPLTTALGGVKSRAARLRPGKGIHVYYDRRLTNYAIVCRAIDGRQVFMEPWQNMTVLGTTDDDYYGDLDGCIATADEVRYLVQAVERIFPAVRSARAIGTWAGVRPTLYEWGPNEDELSRDHRVVDHAADGADGLYSMAGGKLASYRLFAEEMTDVVAARLGRHEKSTTHSSPLPGGDAQVDPLILAKAHAVDPMVAVRLEYRHGTRAERILERVQKTPAEGSVVCPCEPVIDAEVRYVVENEWARTVDDVSRRTRLGLGACGGMRCAARCGAIVAEMTDRSPGEGRRMALDFLELGRRKRAAVVGSLEARSEALALSSLRSALGEPSLPGVD
jgi:glycerol-3-phosphate dehydrogenase